MDVSGSDHLSAGLVPASEPLLAEDALATRDAIHGNEIRLSETNETIRPLQSLLEAESQTLDALSVASQAVCSTLLLLSCLLAAGLLVHESLKGLRLSLYCRLGAHKEHAPMLCVVPLAFMAFLCHVVVIICLSFVMRFAWRSRASGQFFDMEQHHAVLRSDLKLWRAMSCKVLLASGVTYLIVGAPCAGFARLALVFLAAGFLMLYATALFFDDDMDQTQMPPRLLRFLVVYTLVGVTFSALYSGSTNLVLGQNATETAMESKAICSSGLGERQLSQSMCTVPFDLAGTVSLWWAMSPIFAAVLPASGDCFTSNIRRLLQRWRCHVDLVLLVFTGTILIGLRSPCLRKAHVAYEEAQLGAGTISLIILLRRLWPGSCDSWCGPIEHLTPLRNQTNGCCSVCLTDFATNDDACRTPCGHDFHRDCLEQWALSRRFRSADCPVCREPLAIQDARACPGAITNIVGSLQGQN